MAETLTETATCPQCKADVRPGSAFCYNCGGRVEMDGSASGPHDVAAVTEAQKLVADEKVMQPAPGLRTARDIRRRERTFQRKPREVRWESASGSELQLVIVAAAVLVFTIVVIGLALYLK